MLVRQVGETHPQEAHLSYTHGPFAIFTLLKNKQAKKQYTESGLLLESVPFSVIWGNQEFFVRNPSCNPSLKKGGGVNLMNREQNWHQLFDVWTYYVMHLCCFQNNQNNIIWPPPKLNQGPLLLQPKSRQFAWSPPLLPAHAEFQQIKTWSVGWNGEPALSDVVGIWIVMNTILRVLWRMFASPL